MKVNTVIVIIMKVKKMIKTVIPANHLQAAAEQKKKKLPKLYTEM